MEYEKHLRQNGELNLPGSASLPSSGIEKEVRIPMKLCNSYAFG